MKQLDDPFEKLKTAGKSRAKASGSPAAPRQAAPPQSDAPPMSTLPVAERQGCQKPIFGELIVRLPVTNMDDSPWQTRAAPSAAWLKELGDTIDSDGQAAPCLVRMMPGGRVQLIAGHTRKQVALARGWTHLDCRLVECDDSTAERLVLLENAKRRDLTELEKAKAYTSLRDSYKAAGRTQSDLATDLGLSESGLSNTMRLLALNADAGLLARFAAGDFSIEQARALATYAAYPKFAAGFAGHAKNTGVNEGRIEDRHFENCFANGIKCASRPLTKQGFGTSCEFRVTPENESQLDIREVASHGRKERRAFDIVAWNRLNDEAKKKTKEREAKKQAAAASPPTKSSPKNLERTNRGMWRFKHELSESWIELCANAITAKLTGKLTKRQRDIVPRLWSLILDGSVAMEQLLAPDWEAVLLAAVIANATEVARLRKSVFFNGVDATEMRRLACEFDADCESRWTPTESLLEVCAEADLRDLAAECEIAAPDATQSKLIEQLLAVWEPGWVPALFSPEKPRKKEGR